MSGRTVYAYVGNDPLDKTDPSGKVAGVDDAAEAGVAVIGAVAYYGTAAIVAVGVCVDACGAIHDWIGNAAQSAKDKLGNIMEARGKNRLPPTGAPNTTETNAPGTSQRRYGPDGQPVQDWNRGHPDAKPPEDQDHVHDHTPNPNNPTGAPTRQPGRTPGPGDLTGPDKPPPPPPPPPKPPTNPS